jgi:hypothetical protein
MALFRWLGSLVAACLLAACATAPNDRAARLQTEPSAAELHALVDAELAAHPVFLAPLGNDEAARAMTARFESELAQVVKRGCFARADDGLICTFETVLRFPALDGRESRQLWERHVQRIEQRWVLVQAH